MKKFLIISLVVILAMAISFFIINESIPEGNEGPDAEALCEKMLDAIGHDSWERIAFVSWSFRDEHHYVWDKKNHVAQVKWEDYEAVIDLNTVSGNVLKGGNPLEGDAKEEAIHTAWAYFCNDSFWLNAPAKVKDPGTVRKIVTAEDGSQQLLVQYESGGVTPGDSYLWKLDQDFLPASFKMWVSVLPVGGIEATWEDWKEFDRAMLATSHKLGPVEIPIGNLKVGNSAEEFDLTKDYFNSVLK